MKTIKNIFIYSMIIQGIVWIVLTLISFQGDSASNIIDTMMLINGLCYIVLALIVDRKKLFRIAIIFFLAINLILTFTDQVGFYDYLVLALNAISLISFIVYIVIRKKIKAK